MVVWEDVCLFQFVLSSSSSVGGRLPLSICFVFNSFCRKCTCRLNVRQGAEAPGSFEPQTPGLQGTCTNSSLRLVRCYSFVPLYEPEVKNLQFFLLQGEEFSHPGEDWSSAAAPSLTEERAEVALYQNTSEGLGVPWEVFCPTEGE